MSDLDAPAPGRDQPLLDQVEAAIQGPGYSVLRAWLALHGGASARIVLEEITQLVRRLGVGAASAEAHRQEIDKLAQKLKESDYKAFCLQRELAGKQCVQCAGAIDAETGRCGECDEQEASTEAEIDALKAEVQRLTEERDEWRDLYAGTYFAGEQREWARLTAERDRLERVGKMAGETADRYVQQCITLKAERDTALKARDEAQAQIARLNDALALRDNPQW